MTENNYSGIKHVIELKSNKESSCPFCQPSTLRGDMSECINHFITQHEYRILHIGMETQHAPTSGSWHNTVAILGR